MRKFFTKLLPVFSFSLLLSFSVIAQNSDQKQIQQLLQKNASKMGLTIDEVNTAVITDFHTDETTNITYVYLQQAFQQVKLYNTIISASFKNGDLLYASGKFVKNLSAKVSGIVPAKTAVSAVKSAIQLLNLPSSKDLQVTEDNFSNAKNYKFSANDVAKRDIVATLYFLPSKNKEQVTLVWNVNIDVNNSSDEWDIRFDANSGGFIEKYNLTVYESAIPHKAINNCVTTTTKTVKNNAAVNKVNGNLPPSVTGANYLVIPYPFESPNHGAPATVNNPWLLAGVGNNATSLGWHYDGTTSYTITRGNNVFAFLDVKNTNTPTAADNWPDTSSTGFPTLNFNNPPDFTLHPSSKANGNRNKKFALDNLFYWNNLMHDVFYQYGFTEAAGNYQANNSGRGGNQNDAVDANAQDASGTSNANFNAGTDGFKGRMQMFLFNINTPATVKVNFPPSIAGSYNATEGSFSTNNLLLNVGPVTAPVVYYNDVSGGLHEACVTPSNSITGKIALIDRGNCTFVNKVTAARNAGAVGVIVVNYDDAQIGMSGNANSITIPAVAVPSSTGDILKTALANNLNVTLGGPVLKDGDLDNGVICHEYGHGISNRLTGGPSTSSCLSNAEEAGEGWSDYFGLMMTTNWATANATDGALKPRPIGTYVLNMANDDQGIRRVKYCTDMAVDGLTYADMVGSPEVHDIGEIWCSVLWDLTWKLIGQYGITPNLYNSAGTGGNVIALKLVMQGLKLQPCSPGFLDARDAIIAADAALYNSAHLCAIWEVFARRGMGINAVQGSAFDATDQAADYDVPVCNNPVPVTLLSFDARPIGNEVVLDWKTVSEINTKDFTVEYSTNGVNWVSLGSVSAKRGINNSYNFIHKTPVNGNNYYRIKMNDLNGQFKYSAVKVVNKTRTNNPALVLIPNPAKDITTLYISKTTQPTQVNIFDAAGSLVKKFNLLSGIQQTEINTSTLASGIYVIETMINNEKQFIRMMVKH